MNSLKALFSVLVLAGVVSAQTMVTVKTETTVSGAVIRLRDVATVSGAQKAVLDTIEIGRVIAPGTARYFLRDELLSCGRVTPAMKQTITLAGAERCKVTSEFREVKIGDISAMVNERIYAAVSWKRENCKISYKVTESTVLARMGKGSYTIQIEDLRGKYPKGNVMVPVVLIQDGIKERFSVQAYIEVSSEVYVANRKLIAGEDITPADFTKKMMDVTTVPGQPIFSFTSADQYKVKTGIIPEGSVLIASRVDRRQIVETGSPIQIVAKIGVASVVTSGIARESGNVGDRILVENSTSNKLVRGIIVQPGVVQVDKGGRV